MVLYKGMPLHINKYYNSDTACIQLWSTIWRYILRLKRLRFDCCSLRQWEEEEEEEEADPLEMLPHISTPVSQSARCGYITNSISPSVGHRLPTRCQCVRILTRSFTPATFPHHAHLRE